MEFPHIERLMAENQFDTIYHEHFSYFSLSTMERMAAHHRLKVFDVEELSTHGGSLRVYLAHAASARSLTNRVAAVIGRERSQGICDLSSYAAFGEQVKETKRKASYIPDHSQERGQKNLWLRCSRERKHVAELLRDRN